MRAAVYEAPGQPWVLRDVAEPQPGPGDLLIQVGRCGICGSDLHMTDIGAPPLFPTGCVLGHEFSGEVVAMGREVEGFRIGDRIAALSYASCGNCNLCRSGNGMLCIKGPRPILGGFAELAAVPAASAIQLPQSLSLADGALVEPLAVGIHGVNLAETRPETRALVLGAGPIGLAVIYALRLLGVRHIAVVARSTRREDLARSMGASHFGIVGSAGGVDPADPDFGMANVVFECAGVVGALDSCVTFVRPNGLIVSLGICVQPETLALMPATGKQVRIVFSAAFSPAEFQYAVDQLDAGAVEPRAMISSVIPLADLPQTIEALRHGGAQTKVHVAPSS